MLQVTAKSEYTTSSSIQPPLVTVTNQASRWPMTIEGFESSQKQREEKPNSVSR